jgi:hypothetical protein
MGSVLTFDTGDARTGAGQSSQYFAKFFCGGCHVALCRRAMPTGGGASEFYLVLFETRAANSSNLESRSFRMGDLFDFL